MSKRKPTIAKQYELANEAELLQYFRSLITGNGLVDTRRGQGMRYPFISVVVIGLISMVASMEDFKGMEIYANHHEDWLCKWLDLPHKAPTQEVFRRVISALDPAVFAKVMSAWQEKVHMQGETTHIAIDGKSLRSSVSHVRGERCLHGLNVYDVGRKMVIGHGLVDKKKNEITATPSHLEIST